MGAALKRRKWPWKSFAGLCCSLWTFWIVFSPRGRERFESISRWQRSFCLLSALNLEPQDLHELCGRLDSQYNDEISCVEALYAKKHGKRFPRCVSTDYSDVSIQSDVLLKYRQYSLSKVPAPVRTKNKVLITVFVKDESRLLVISVIWHLLQGVDHYYVCNNSPGNKVIGRVLRPLIDLGFVTLVPYPGTGVQAKCYDDGLAFARTKEYTWQAGLDVDEFLLMSPEFTTVHSMLHLFSVEDEKNENIAGVAVNWIMQPSYRQLSVHYPTDQFTTPASKLNFEFGCAHDHVKTFARVAYVSCWDQVHMPLRLLTTNSSVVNTARKKIETIGAMFRTQPQVPVAVLLHYRYRSMQEHVAKRERVGNS